MTQKWRILNVDDNDAGRYATTKILKKAGFDVIEAVNGTDALTLAATQNPDLVLLDVNLPDITGFEVCRRLKQDTKTASIPVVHLSATLVNSPARVEGLEGGADGYLVLPIEPEELVATIRSFLRIRSAEMALRESEEKFRTLAETTPVAIMIYQGDRWVYSNPAGEWMSGYSCKELYAMNYWDFVAPEFRQLIRDRGKQRQAGEQLPRSYDFRIIAKDGTEKWVSLTGSQFQFKGEPAGLISVIDITGRKRAEEALHYSDERFRGLFETVTSGIAIYEVRNDGLSGKDYIIKDFNKMALEIEGKKKEEVIGKSLFDLRPTIDEYGLIPVFRQVWKTGVPEYFPQKIYVDENFTSWYENRVLRLQSGEIVAVYNDITERKLMEDEIRSLNITLEQRVLERTGQLNASLDEKVILLREIHHRVKNNLQIILSLISLQSRNIKDPKLQETMGEFRDRIMAMAHVHERMYRAEDISRIDLSEIVIFLGTALFKSYNVDPRHIRLNVEIKDLQINIDTAIPLSLIINELVSNSIKHAFPQGTTGEITIAGHRVDDTLILSFRDTGIGIPKELDWIRNDQTLGHRLVVGLVQQLSGTIELDPTAGTTFNIVVKEKE